MNRSESEVHDWEIFVNSENADSTTEILRTKKCLPCEGGVEPLTAEQASGLLSGLSGWSLSSDGKSIARSVKCKHFPAAIELVNQIAELAEQEQHHPDLHLTGYRHLAVVLTTHAIGGLSENDFIVAAKIDPLIDV